jgi:hypothetical protein
MTLEFLELREILELQLDCVSFLNYSWVAWIIPELQLSCKNYSWIAWVTWIATELRELHLNYRNYSWVTWITPELLELQLSCVNCSWIASIGSSKVLNIYPLQKPSLSTNTFQGILTQKHTQKHNTKTHKTQKLKQITSVFMLRSMIAQMRPSGE